MRSKTRNDIAHLRRSVDRRRYFAEDNDPLFDERDIDYCSFMADEKTVAVEK